MDGNNSAPSIRQYFANESSSPFDEIVKQQPPPQQQAHSSTATATAYRSSPQAAATQRPVPVSVLSAPQPYASPLIASSFNGSFSAPEYVEQPAEDAQLPDDVRNMWDSALTEPGKPPMLTTPGLSRPDEFLDEIASCAKNYLEPSELASRKILNAEQVTQDERGLRQLIHAGCYRAALNLTGRLLTTFGQGFGRLGQPAKHTPHSLQLWFTRLALLAQLRKTQQLQAESEPFEQLTRPDVYYEFYPELYNGKRGSIASFTFRLLLAELPLHMMKPHVALDQLSELYVIAQEIKAYYEQRDYALAAAFWARRAERVLHSIINIALLLKRYNMIDDIIERVLLPVTDRSKEERRALYSAWGRIYLQFGDIFGAEQKFSIARCMRDATSAADLRDLVDKALITVAKEQYQEAFTTFQKALHIDNGNTMVLNNMGISLFYAGKLKDAINVYERAINRNPQKALTVNLLRNLVVLYDLESDNAAEKKLNLLRLINRYVPDLTVSVDQLLNLR